MAMNMKMRNQAAKRGGLLLCLSLCVLATGCREGALSYEYVDASQVPTPGQTSPDDGGKENSQTPDDPREDPPIVIPDGPMAGRSPMRLLTRYEYDNTTSALFGFTISAASDFPSENLADGFENNAWTHNVNMTLLRSYINASESISARAWEDPPAALSGCVGNASSSALCLEGIEDFTSIAFRRPAYEDEVALYQKLYRDMRSSEGARVAFETTVQAILQSPQFLYRLELFEPSPMKLPPRDGGMDAERFELVGPYEMASRLSYFIWGTMPDEELLAAAERGDLNTPEVLSEQVARMIADPRAREMTRQFHRQWLGLDAFGSVVKDETAFPMWKDGMSQDLRLSIEAFIEHVYWEEGAFDAFMTSPAVFLTPELAPLYGKAINEESGGLWREDFPAEERAGILTQPGMMALLAYPNQGSPIFRAIWVRERLLCQHLPPPPSDIQIEPPDPDPNATTREVFAIHTANEECAECHLLIDPLGFGFEGYDALGRWRDTENGKAIDTSGELIGSPEQAMNGPFDGVVDLANRLADSEAIAKCISKQWFTFAMGRPNDTSDGDSMSRIYEQFLQDETAFPSLFEAIVLSDSFRYRKRPEVAQAEFEEANPDLVAMENAAEEQGGE
jgi:hypothetical protein